MGTRSTIAATIAALVVAACSSSTTAGPTPTSATYPTTTSAPAHGTTPPSTGTGWAGAVDERALPLGDGHVSTSKPGVGQLLACPGGGGPGGGASQDGPWIHGSTWDATAKVAVAGSHAWPSATFSTSTTASTRDFVTNDLPTRQVTGTFPIAATDPAHQYDQNPNAIAAQALRISVPRHPRPASAPGCLSGGPIGILLNGVVLFDAVDAGNRDAVAHETQDRCQGHPAPGDEYHYHSIPTCLLAGATARSQVVGWADDGYPIAVERDAAGRLPSDADLDACHGRTSAITVDGRPTTSYHYDATLEFPYTLGCYHGVAVPAHPA